MKKIKSYTLTEELSDIIREMSFAMEISESAFVQRAVEHFLRHGISKDFKEQTDKKRDAIAGVIEAIKQNRNKNLLEVGKQYEQD